MKKRWATIRRAHSFIIVLAAAAVAVLHLAGTVCAGGADDTRPEIGSIIGKSGKAREGAELPRGSDQTYRVRWLQSAGIVLDGKADEPAWSLASPETGFFFPWKKAPAPATEFRALCDEKSLYLAFRVEDGDIVVLERLRHEEEAVFEDRVEVYFGLDEEMNDYFCLEVDPKGRVFDYRGAYPRKLDPKWNFEGLEARAMDRADGYEVEVRIPTRTFSALGFPALRPGAKFRCGLYRAEFSHDRSGRKVEPQASIHTMGLRPEGPPPIEDWLSWVDPKTEEPDFHVPSSMGWMEIVNMTKFEANGCRPERRWRSRGQDLSSRHE